MKEIANGHRVRLKEMGFEMCLLSGGGIPEGGYETQVNAVRSPADLNALVECICTNIY